MSDIVTDKQLVDSYLKGDVESFKILMARYENKIFSYLLMLVKDRQVAEDLFQDTFLKIIKTIKAGTYEEEGKFIQFAMRIAHNLVIDNFRQSARLQIVESSNKDYDFVDCAKMTDPSVEETMITNQVYDDLHKMVELLPNDQKEVIYMRLYEDMSFKEIAEVVNVSINTALGRMRYAIINLRKMAKKYNLSLSYN